jgi:hypothetical protein
MDSACAHLLDSAVFFKTCGHYCDAACSTALGSHFHLVSPSCHRRLPKIESANKIDTKQSTMQYHKYYVLCTQTSMRIHENASRHRGILLHLAGLCTSNQLEDACDIDHDEKKQIK